MERKGRKKMGRQHRRSPCRFGFIMKQINSEWIKRNKELKYQVISVTFFLPLPTTNSNKCSNFLYIETSKFKCFVWKNGK